jgi:methionyl-tRNA formyltransferase
MVMPLRVLFFGTPAFAVPSLTRLFESAHEVVGVVTQPDRPRGRGQRIAPEAVKVAAVAQGVTVLQPGTLNDTAFLSSVRALAPDLGVVAAYGRLLPQSLLEVPRLGLINVHASLLPRWRGAAPVHRAILAGDGTTGVTIMRVVLALDAGPMLARVATDIADNETSHELDARLAELGAGLLVDTIDRLAAGPIAEEAQDEQLVTYAARLERREGQVDWARSATEVHNQIRGLQPWPLAAALLGGRRVMFLRSSVDPEITSAVSFGEPGTVVHVDRHSFSVATLGGSVRILELQEAGRAPMGVGAYLNGRPVAVGDRLLPLPGPAA